MIHFVIVWSISFAGCLKVSADEDKVDKMRNLPPNDVADGLILKIYNKNSSEQFFLEADNDVVLGGTG